MMPTMMPADDDVVDDHLGVLKHGTCTLRQNVATPLSQDRNFACNIQHVQKQSHVAILTAEQRSTQEGIGSFIQGVFSLAS
eukprot:scaffold16972_cov94-Skeletonema_dohrnii-CCMP3373.AAC.4